jgi:hypothetical protein
MSNSPSSSQGQQVNEIKKSISFDDLANPVTFNIDLKPGANRLVIRVRGSFILSV